MAWHPTTATHCHGAASAASCPRLTCPTSRGLQVLEISYWRMSPCSQLQTYRYLSSREMTRSLGKAGRAEKKEPWVRRHPQKTPCTHGSTCREEMRSSTGGSPGILGRIHPDTSLAGIWMASSTAQLSLCTRNARLTPAARLALLALGSPPSIGALSRSHSRGPRGRRPSTCLALVEAVDDAAQGTADVALGSIGVVQELHAQGQRVLPQVKALREGTAGQIPHVQAAPEDPCAGGGEVSREGRAALEVGDTYGALPVPSLQLPPILEFLCVARQPAERCPAPASAFPHLSSDHPG